MARLALGLSIWVISFLLGCTGLPEGIEPVENFDAKRYLGKWYEIARLDHRFERNLSNVSATYSSRNPDGITVINRGYNVKKKKWKSIEGVAWFTANENTGSLKVSFFGPFYGGYHIVDLDEQNYSYSMVVGPDRSYFWILSRDRKMDRALYQNLVSNAEKMGINTAKLILVDQNLPEE